MKKQDNTIYTIEITGEQIKTIRSLYLRAEMIYVHQKVAEVVNQSGEVERLPLYECHFCRKASYGSIAEIPHTKQCIVVLTDKEFDTLNAQFIQALERVEVQP